MTRILILVEGDTEEQFVKGVLTPHFAHLDKYLIPTIATTRRLLGRPHSKGGIVSYGKVRNDILRLCHDSDAICITTMIDYYGLPRGFPGMKDRPRGSAHEQVRHLESAFANDISDPRFEPYLALHEFEAMLFASPEKLAQIAPAYDVSDDLRQIRTSFQSPEEIDDQDPPSKRILRLIPRYQKPANGVLIAREIGLDIIRAECPHFNQWIKQLEKLGKDK